MCGVVSDRLSAGYRVHVPEAAPSPTVRRTGSRTGTGDGPGAAAVPGPLPAARIAFLVLAVASFIALFAFQRLKLTRPAIVDHPSTPLLTPNGDGIDDAAGVRFRVVSHDRVTVAVVDSRGTTVRTLLRRKPVRDKGLVDVDWDGRRDGGALAAPGSYRVRVGLARAGRSGLTQTTIRLSDVPPHAGP